MGYIINNTVGLSRVICLSIATSRKTKLSTHLHTYTTTLRTCGLLSVKYRFWNKEQSKTLRSRLPRYRYLVRYKVICTPTHLHVNSRICGLLSVKYGPIVKQHGRTSKGHLPRYRYLAKKQRHLRAYTLARRLEDLRFVVGVPLQKSMCQRKGTDAHLKRILIVCPCFVKMLQVGQRLVIGEIF